MLYIDYSGNFNKKKFMLEFSINIKNLIIGQGKVLWRCSPAGSFELTLNLSIQAIIRLAT